jgi:hypothetical protein
MCTLTSLISQRLVFNFSDLILNFLNFPLRAARRRRNRPHDGNRLPP